MDFKGFAKRWQEPIEDRIRVILDKTGTPDKITNQAIERIKEFSTRPGKKIRPVLMIASYEMLGGKNDIVDIAAAYELLHNYFLIHDDIMDGTDLRRGKPTLHKIYENLEDDYNRGVGHAIISGDTLCAIAYSTIICSTIPDKLKIETIELFNSIILKTCYGQIIDFSIESSDEGRILLIHEYKTSRYTIQGPLEMGSLLAGKRTDFSRISLPLGLAFQIKDDLLDMFSQESGKDLFKDIREGKNTLHIDYARKNSLSEELNKIGNKDLSFEDCLKIKRIVEETGGRDYAESRIKHYISQAESEITTSALPEDFKRFLLDFCGFLLDRKS